jgi:hypothetical protein
MAQPEVFNWATSTGGLVVGPLTITAAQWVENQQDGDVLYGLIRYTCSGSPALSGVLQSHRLDVSGFTNALNNGVHYIVSADNVGKTITVRMTARTDATADQAGASATGNVYDIGALLQKPSPQKQAQGYIPSEKPNAQQLNWMLNAFGNWTQYIATGDAGIIGAADLTALAAIDTTGFTGRAALVADIGAYRWVSGSALTADGYTVVDSDVAGQWVLEAASPQPVIADDDLTIARGGRYIVDAATAKTLTLPADIRPGYEIEIVNQGAGGFVVSTNSGQKLRDADTEYGPAPTSIENLDPYTAIRLMATDTDTFTMMSKNGAIDIFQDNLLWSVYTKTAFSTTSTSYVDAQEVTFRTRNAGSRILALVSVDFGGTANLGRIAITFNGGSQDFIYQDTTSGGAGAQGIIIPQMSGTLSPGNHTVTVEIRSESGGTFAGNVQIVCHEVESGRYLGAGTFTGQTVNVGNTSNFGVITATFSGSPAIMLCGVAKCQAVGGDVLATISGVNITQSNADIGGGGTQEIRQNATSVWGSASMLKMVKSGGSAYPASGDQLGMRINASLFGTSAGSIDGRTYAIALPAADVTDFEASTTVAGSPTGTSWVTVRELDATLSEQSDLYLVASARHSGTSGPRPRARILVDSVDVTGTVPFSVNTGSGSVHLSALVEGLAAGTRSIELQISLSGSGTIGLSSAQIMAYRVRDV